jgi:hypothetical protein
LTTFDCLIDAQNLTAKIREILAKLQSLQVTDESGSYITPEALQVGYIHSQY